MKDYSGIPRCGREEKHQYVQNRKLVVEEAAGNEVEKGAREES